MTHPQRQSLKRLRKKVALLAAEGDGDRYSESDLIQLSCALAKRRLEDQVRADQNDRERLTEAHLGVRWDEIAVSAATIVEPHVKPVLRLIGRQLARFDAVEFAGAKTGSPPRWDRFELGEEVEMVPGWATIYWDAGTVSPSPLVLETWDRNATQAVQVFSRADDHQHAKRYLDQLIADAKRPDSPFRGRLSRAVWGQMGLQLEILPDPDDVRERLVLPTTVWNAIDQNVHKMFERMDVFRAAGLGSNRGVLFAGPAGTGKTAACRILAHELRDRVTAVFVESNVAQGLLPTLYEQITGFAPAILMLEDIDLLVGGRQAKSAKRPLLDFLTVLDGLMTQHHDVVTIATTNDPDAVDEAVRRAARFDRVIGFPIPDTRARRAILDVYLAAVEHDVDTEHVARVTEGWTGADLRESVRAALLVASEPLSTGDLIQAADAVAQPKSSPNGRRKNRNYL